MSETPIRKLPVVRVVYYDHHLMADPVPEEDIAEYVSTEKMGFIISEVGFLLGEDDKSILLAHIQNEDRTATEKTFHYEYVSRVLKCCIISQKRYEDDEGLSLRAL